MAASAVIKKVKVDATSQTKVGNESTVEDVAKTSANLITWEGGTPNSDLNAWAASVRERPAPVALELVVLTDLLTSSNFPEIENIDSVREKLGQAIKKHAGNTVDEGDAPDQFAQPEDSITDIQILTGKRPRLEGYTIRDEDLNEEAGGDYIWLAFRRDKVARAIRDIKFFKPEGYKAKEGDWVAYNSVKNSDEAKNYTVLKRALNDNAGGQYIFCGFSKMLTENGKPDGNVMKPIVDLKVAYNHRSVPGEGFERIEQDLNEGAGGDFIHVWAKRAP